MTCSTHGKPDRCRLIRNSVGLLLYLAGGWRSYQDIGEEFGWACTNHVWNSHTCKTAWRNVRALEQAGLPVEWSDDKPSRIRIAPDWVARTPWLRRYIIVKDVVKGA